MVSVSQRIANALVRYGNGSEANVDIYEYGIQALLSFAINAVVTVILGVLFGVVSELILFFIPFALHRSISGGYHAKTWWGCVVFSGIVIAFVILLCKLHFAVNLFFASILVSFFAAITTFCFAPVVNSNHPLNNDERLRFRKLSRSMTAILITLEIIAFFVGMSRFGFCVALALGVSSSMQVIGVIQGRR